MINFNDPFVGEVIMYIYIVLFSIIIGYGVFKLTRPFEEKMAKLKK